MLFFSSPCFTSSPEKRALSRSLPLSLSLSFLSFFQNNRGLWAGSGPTVMRLSAGLAIQFLAIDSLKDFVASRAAKRRQLEEVEDGERKSGKAKKRSASAATSAAADASTKPVLTAGEAFLVGGGARALSSALTSPLTLVKTRMEFCGSGAASASASSAASSSLKGMSTVSALATIGRTEGARGLLRGLGPTVAANAPFSAIYYSFYSRLRVQFAEAGAPAAASNFGAGLLAAAAATVLTQPADMVRTHMQLGLGGSGGIGAAAAGAAAGAATGTPSAAAIAAAASSSSLGPWQTLSTVIRTRGPGALLAGTAPRILKRTLQTALVWTLYEELQPRIATAASGAGGAIKKGIAAAKENLAGSDSDSNSSNEKGGGSKSRSRMASASVAAFDVR